MNILKQIGVDGKDLRLIKNIYEMQRVALQLGGEPMDWIDIKRGVRQGCVMSPDLFNIFAEFIMRNIEEDGIRVGGKNINNIRYADDTVLIADSEEKLKISMASRKRFIKCYIWSTLLYGYETWNINNQTRMRLEAFEMKILC